MEHPLPREPWQLRYRFRYYRSRVPGDAFSGEDEKSFYSANRDARTPESAMLEASRAIADSLVMMGFNESIDWLVLQTSHFANIRAALESRPWFHSMPVAGTA